ncbi:uncharacterized protein [Eucyclogobius newberryi]|uniref:uncharacterized protein n=1 Tax=Eucyclogobius newberryi TaxID=166745 RepID=UPI003B5A4BE5
MYSIPVFSVDMSGALLVGNQLILEEEYDGDYIPSEQEVRDYANEIGIDPDTEPELMWLAREGAIAPLPSGWKPCQDVTGDIYYFNFSTGDSSWEHPGDESYRNLVLQERERSKQTSSSIGAGAKKVKKKKEKKVKVKKKKEDSLVSGLRPITSPLGGLAPLSGLDTPGLGLLGSVPPLRRALGSAGGLEPLKTSLGDPRSSGVSSVLGMRKEERVSLTLPGLDDDDEDDYEDKIAENKPSWNNSDRLLKNLHLNIDGLGSGLQYEDSEGSGEAPEPELQNLGLSGDLSPEPPSQQDDGNASSLAHSKLKNLGDVDDLLGSFTSPLLKKSAENRPKQKEAPASRVDRLTLHESSPSPSFSNSSRSHTQDNDVHPENTDLGPSFGFKRPETSRGRPSRGQDSERSIQSGEKREEAVERHKSTSDHEEEEQRERLMNEKQERIQKLQDELKRQEEEEERRLKAESEESLRALRQSLMTKRKGEEAKLQEESEKILEELRASVRADREEQEEKIRQERKAIVADLQAELEEEREAERTKLDAKKRQDMERLKAQIEEELEEERRRLQRNKEERLGSLREEVKNAGGRNDVLSPKPEQHLTEYRRDLSNVLQEMREEEEREHRRKLDQLKETHMREINDIREKYRDEEIIERERSITRLKDERRQLEASHALELEKIRAQHNAQIERIELENTRKEKELGDLSNELELRSVRVQSQEAVLQSKEEDLDRRRKHLGMEEQEVDRQTESLPRLIHERDVLKEELEREREEKRQAQELMRVARGERNKAKTVETRLREERDRAREEQRRSQEEQRKSQEEQRRCQEEQGRLERKVQLLQERRCERLGLGDSAFGGGAEASTFNLDPKSDRKESEGPGSDRDTPLDVEELEPPLSPAADSHSSLHDVKKYIISHGDSVQKTKVFLARESRKLVEREAALRAAQTIPGLESGGVAEDVIQNLQQEARIVGDLQQTVQTGFSLLQRKEEKLQHLSSVTDEPLFENVSRIPDRTVTFDVTESDVSSAVDPPFSRDQSAVPHRVQDLVESLQEISGQLNTVVGVLGSLAHRPSPAFTLPEPVLDFSHTRRSQASEPWAPPPPMFSSTLNPGPKASDDLIQRRWRQIFPGAAMGPSASKRNASYSSPLSQSGWSSSYRQSATEADGHRLQDLIDSNRKWLEIRRKDTNIPLLTRYRPATTDRIQLGLDDHNDVRVFHY